MYNHIILFVVVVLLLISLCFLLGTNGAVSVAGTLSSAVGGSIVGLAYFVVIYLCGTEAAVEVNTPPQWPLVIVTTLTGLLGSLIDSFLGATLQYSGEYWLVCAYLSLAAVILVLFT